MGSVILGVVGAFGNGEDEVETLRLENARLKQELTAAHAKIGEMKRVGGQPADSMLTLESAAKLAHEFRNPMSAIGNCIEILNKSLKPEGDEKELIEIALSEWERLNRVMTDFLSFGRFQAPNRRSTNIHQVLDKTVLLLRHDTRYVPEIKLIRDYGQSIPQILVDPDQFSQVFWNLILNAVQVTPPGGQIVLKTRVEPHATRRSCLCITVSDNGPGMPAEVLAKALQPFFTTKTSGTGLGLAIVHQIVKAHDGRLTIKSEEGQGTEITIKIPLLPP